MLERINQYLFSSDSKPGRNLSLDGLRGIAVLLVVGAHLSFDPHNINLLPFLDFTALGKTGVYLFFVLSSYLLDRQILLAIKNESDGIGFWKNYFLRRVLRIYPLYLFLLLCYFLIYKLGSDICICMRGPEDILSHLFLAKGFGPFWSIPVEFKYYILSPFLMYVITDLFQSKKAIVLPFFISLMLGISWYTYSNDYLNEGVVSEMWPYLPVFLCGSLLAFLEVNSSTKQQNVLFDICGFVLIMMAIILGGSYFFNEIIGWKHSYVFSIFRKFIVIQGFFFMLVIYCSNRSSNFFQRILQFKGLRFIGLISFGIYLIHWPIVKLFGRLDSGDYHPTLLWIGFFLLVLLLSTITHVFIEKPASRISLLKRKNISK